MLRDPLRSLVGGVSVRGWRIAILSLVVSFGILVAAGIGTARVSAAGGCSLALSGYPQVGNSISITGTGFPLSADVDISFTVDGTVADAFQLASDSGGNFRIDLLLETPDLGATTVSASVAGTACSARLSYTVVGAPGPTGAGPSATPTASTGQPMPTPGPTVTPTTRPSATPTPRPTAKPKPTPTPRPRATPKASPRPSPTHRATATLGPGQTPRPSHHPSASASGGAAGAGGTTLPPTDRSTGGTGDATPVMILALAAVAFLAVGLGGWLADRRRAVQSPPPR